MQHGVGQRCLPFWIASVIVETNVQLVGKVNLLTRINIIQ